MYSSLPPAALLPTGTCYGSVLRSTCPCNHHKDELLAVVLFKQHKFNPEKLGRSAVTDLGLKDANFYRCVNICATDCGILIKTP